MLEISNSRTQIMYLTAPSVGESKVSERIQQISEILKINPELQQDLPLVKRVVDLTRKSCDPEVQKFRAELLECFCVRNENGILVVKVPAFVREEEKEFFPVGFMQVASVTISTTEETLKNYDKDKFWDLIKKQGVKELAIGQDVTYEGRVLEELIKKRPHLEALTQNYTLKFPEGEVVESAAKLLLCGGFFEDILESKMSETLSRKIDLTESVSLLGFLKILEAVETGHKDLEDVEGLYKAACGYILFGKRGIPEDAFGPAEWEKYYGLKVDDVPAVPKGFFQSLDKPCPYSEGKKISETHALFLVPKGLSLNKMEELAKAPKEGGEVKYRFYWDLMKRGYGSRQVEASYWVLMFKDVIPGSRGKTRREQLSLASSVAGCEAPSLLEAVVCNIGEYLKSGKRLFGVEPLTYTCCREEPIEEMKLVVGSFSLAGLCVNLYFDYHGDVGVSVVRRK